MNGDLPRNRYRHSGGDSIAGDAALEVVKRGAACSAYTRAVLTFLMRVHIAGDVCSKIFLSPARAHRLRLACSFPFHFGCMLMRAFLALTQSANENTLLLSLSAWCLLSARLEYTHSSLNVTYRCDKSRTSAGRLVTCRYTVRPSTRGGGKCTTTSSERRFPSGASSRCVRPPKTDGN